MCSRAKQTSALVLISLLYLGVSASSPAAEKLAASQPKPPRTLRVLALNTWQEGRSVKNGFAMIVEAIIASKADIVTLAEVRNRKGEDLHQKLIAALKKKGHTFYGRYVAGDAGLISRYPVAAQKAVFTTPKKEDAGCIIAYHLQVAPGLRVVVGSAHLDYRHYATYAPRGYHHSKFKIIDPDKDGRPNPITDVKAIMAIDKQSKRDDAIRAFVDYVRGSGLGGGAVILMGDFNECSHLDWTEQTKDLYSHNGMAIAWANSSYLSASAFVDAYRELHPNPVTHPGATWPSEAKGRGSTSWAPKCDERDRIDFVYYNRKRLRATSAALVGSRRYYVYNKLAEAKGRDTFLLQESPWPTDHKGVVVDFEITRDQATDRTSAKTTKDSGAVNGNGSTTNKKLPITK